jgi:long-chain acyl-CoA synthetase
MVYGDKRPHLVALIVPEEAFVHEFAKSRQLARDWAALARNPDFRAAIGQAIDRVNKDLSNLEKIRRFAIAPEPFTVENEMMTPTLKIRRHRIISKYSKDIDDLY